MYIFGGQSWNTGIPVHILSFVPRLRHYNQDITGYLDPGIKIFIILRSQDLGIDFIDDRD